MIIRKIKYSFINKKHLLDFEELLSSTTLINL